MKRTSDLKMSKKKLAYLLAASENIIFAAANVAISLNKYMPNKEFDIILMSANLSDQNKKALEKIPNVQLREYNIPTEVRDFLLSPHGLPRGRWNNPNSLFTMAHYEIFNLLEEYETAIWLDVDISIQRDISSLEEYGPLAIAKDLNFNKIWKVGDQFEKNLPSYDMSLDSYINAVIVAKDTIPGWQTMTQECLDLTMKYAPLLKNIDQAVFSMLFQNRHFYPQELPWNEFVCHAHHEAASIARLVHFGTQDKVWNNCLLFQCYPEWFRVHLDWLELGGQDFDRSFLSSKAIYFEITKGAFSDAGWSGSRSLKRRVLNHFANFYKSAEKNTFVYKMSNTKILERNGRAYTLREVLKSLFLKVR